MHRIVIFMLAVFAFQAVAGVDFYSVLGVNKNSDQADIKRAFRKLSVKYHPDKNPGDQEAAQKFQELNKAYEVLSNSEKRQIYDLRGEEGLKQAESGQTDFWGNPMGQQRGPNAKADIQVTLEELYNGATKEMSIQRNVICSTCRGTGSKDGKISQCQHCGGRGVRMQKMQMGGGMVFQMQTTCEYCGGSGKMTVRNCPTCSGQRVVPNKKVLKVEIEKGMRDGQEVVFEKESEQSPDYIPGDVIFTLRQKKHSYFNRVGDNLYMDLKITLKEAILGVTRRVKHLDDHYTEIKTNDVVQPFYVKTISEEGMPLHNFPSQKGDLYVKFIVNLPQKLTDKQRELAKQIFSKSQ